MFIIFNSCQPSDPSSIALDLNRPPIQPPFPKRAATETGRVLSNPSSFPGIPAHFIPSLDPTILVPVATQATIPTPTPTRKYPGPITSPIAVADSTAATSSSLGTHGFFQLLVLVLVPILSTRAILLDWPSTRNWICAHVRCHDLEPAGYCSRVKQEFSFVNVGGGMIV